VTVEATSSAEDARFSASSVAPCRSSRWGARPLGDLLDRVGDGPGRRSEALRAVVDGAGHVGGVLGDGCDGGDRPLQFVGHLVERGADPRHRLVVAIGVDPLGQVAVGERAHRRLVLGRLALDRLGAARRLASRPLSLFAGRLSVVDLGAERAAHGVERSEQPPDLIGASRLQPHVEIPLSHPLGLVRKLSQGDDRVRSDGDTDKCEPDHRQQRHPDEPGADLRTRGPGLLRAEVDDDAV